MELAVYNSVYASQPLLFPWNRIQWSVVNCFILIILTPFTLESMHRQHYIVQVISSLTIKDLYQYSKNHIASYWNIIFVVWIDWVRFLIEKWLWHHVSNAHCHVIQFQQFFKWLILLDCMSNECEWMHYISIIMMHTSCTIDIFVYLRTKNH